LIEPIAAEGIEIKFYEIDHQLEFKAGPPKIAAEDVLVYVNYFGLKSAYSEELSYLYGEQLWIDDTQAFFHRPLELHSSYFNSARKFFGIPDGAYLYCSLTEVDNAVSALPEHCDYRTDHLVRRALGDVQGGYASFKENEVCCGGLSAQASTLSRVALQRIDYWAVAWKRRRNFEWLCDALDPSNRLSGVWSVLADGDIPLCYPYLPERQISRRALWEAGLFIPSYWNDCLYRTNRGYRWEKELSANLLPLPVDQRYGIAEMDDVLKLIQGL
jgi:hypothetical protein